MYFSDLTVDGNSLLLHSQKSVTQSNSIIAYSDHVREGHLDKKYIFDEIVQESHN